MKKATKKTKFLNMATPAPKVNKFWNFTEHGNDAELQLSERFLRKKTGGVTIVSLTEILSTI